MTAPTFESLLDRHYQEILRYTLRSLGDLHMAEDACQDTFLRAFRARHRLSAVANPRAWLYKVASNACHDARRRQARQPLPLSDPLPAPDCPDSDDRALATAVADFVRSLPRRQRDAVVLRKFQDMDYGEIAGVLGCSAEAARASVYQGLRKVRAHFVEVTDA